MKLARVKVSPQDQFEWMLESWFGEELLFGVIFCTCLTLFIYIID
jgi:hypothetical protein